MTRPPRYVDEHSADSPRARRLRPEALDPRWEMECFMDRALDHANPQAGLFVLAFALTSLVKLAAEVKAEDDARAAAAREAQP